MFWPETIDEYCNCLQNEFELSDTKIIIKSDKNYNISKIIKDYIDCENNNIILVKTSVTGNRKGFHEIDTILLDEVLKNIRDIAPVSTIILADGPAYSESYQKECDKLEWSKLAYKYDVKIQDLNHDDYILIDNYWPISKQWLSAKKVINLSKAKTHKRFGVTLSSKNLIGTLSGKVLGYPKLVNKHEYVPKLINTIISVSPKMLCIIDGINGIEGEGPMNGKIINSNFLVLGTDPLNCDALATIQMGFHPAVVLNTIRPFKSKSTNNTFQSICALKKTRKNYMPSYSCAWMYKSLYKKNNKLNKIYVNCVEEIKKCWMK